jgi:hypothetical protein
MFQVNEIVNLRRIGLETLAVVVEMVGRDECRSRWVGTDLQRDVVFLLQVSADFAEFRKSGPASADVASTRHSMTFALVPHQFMKSLGNFKGENNFYSLVSIPI